MNSYDPLQLIERVRNRLAFFLVGAFVAVIPFLIWKTIPEGNKDILVYMVGQLSGMATMALGFYFVSQVGKDALDAKKSENTGKLADAITATAKAGGIADPTTLAAEGADEAARAAADEAERIRNEGVGQ